MDREKMISWIVEGEEGKDLRLDQEATRYLGDFSRSRISKAIKNGAIKVNGDQSKSSSPVKKGDRIQADLSALNIPPIGPEQVPLDILYQDEDLLVINKPAGMIVHPTLTVREGTLVNALLGMGIPLSQVNGPLRPGIVHRLDAQTSGAIMIAKNDSSHLKLAQDLQLRMIQKTYLAICQGKWDVNHMRIDLPIGRSPSQPQKREVILEGGKEAITIANTLSIGEEASLIAFQILTGRTHQIRVHARAMKHPVVGDRLYGYKKERHPTAHQLLHSFYLCFCHPRTGKKLQFFAPWDQEFERMAKIYALELPKIGDFSFIEQSQRKDE